MYISKIHIKNYRNFDDFSMDFNNGLNVIIGSNNSGKTGLLRAINLLSCPSLISVQDFNKSNLVKYKTKYNNNPPEIEIEYFIKHTIIEDDTSDESIIKLVPFLGIEDFENNRIEDNEGIKYVVKAKIKAVFSLDIKYLNEYKKELESVKDFKQYFIMLTNFVDKYYSWNYTNGITDLKIEQKNATKIFDIQLIDAERKSEEVAKEAKREIERFIKESNTSIELEKFKNDISLKLKKLLEKVITKLSNLFENENNDVGLQNGNITIFSDVRADFSVSDAYVTEVQDTKNGFVIPLQNNGLGYNNLINIYMLIKLADVKKKDNFKILCLEEPEAHLHPAMQYKLFKYLKELDKENKLNQQIFVTTHSSNISAVAGIDNMFMISYERSKDTSNCHQQSLKQQFTDTDDSTNKKDAKLHLTKFLDVTRSDMLFADKVILVEGIAEKLLLPLFMEKCNCPYEDKYVSIVEIGGKHFEHFVELFNKNSVNKKVLCITDKDFNWSEDDKLASLKEYNSYEPNHLKKLKERFNIDNFHVCTQSQGGKTFEDELMIANIEEKDTSSALFKIVLCESLKSFFDIYNFSLEEWEKHLNEIGNKSSKSVVIKYLKLFNERIDKAAKEKKFYNNLIFAELFLHYAQNRKGELALSILTDENLSNKIIVPNYIQEGLKWLMK